MYCIYGNGTSQIKKRILFGTGIEPSNDKGRKNSNVKGGKTSPLSLLQNSVVDCERKKIIVSFPRDLEDSLGVIWMALTDSSCTS